MSATIESDAVLPGKNARVFLALLRQFSEMAKERGYHKLKMHVESGGRVHSALRKKGTVELGRFHNFMGWEKTYSYLEVCL